MKVLIKSLCVGFAVAILFAFLPFEGECREISNQVFRVHILANSDSEEDQNLKLKVRDTLIKEGELLFENVHSKEEAKLVVQENLPYFVSLAENVVESEGYDYTVTGAVKNLCFDTRCYEDITMPGGFYDALQIKIGKAEGKNWWCVMYPSLCLYSASENDTLDERLSDTQYSIISSDTEFEFRFKVVEIFNSILDFFS